MDGAIRCLGFWLWPLSLLQFSFTNTAKDFVERQSCNVSRACSCKANDDTNSGVYMREITSDMFLGQLQPHASLHVVFNHTITRLIRAAAQVVGIRYSGVLVSVERAVHPGFPGPIMFWLHHITQNACRFTT